jgi:hypothetical protein
MSRGETRTSDAKPEVRPPVVARLLQLRVVLGDLEAAAPKSIAQSSQVRSSGREAGARSASIASAARVRLRRAASRAGAAARRPCRLRAREEEVGQLVVERGCTRRSSTTSPVPLARRLRFSMRRSGCPLLPENPPPRPVVEPARARGPSPCASFIISTPERRPRRPCGGSPQPVVEAARPDEPAVLLR